MRDGSQGRGVPGANAIHRSTGTKSLDGFGVRVGGIGYDDALQSALVSIATGPNRDGQEMTLAANLFELIFTAIASRGAGHFFSPVGVSLSVIKNIEPFHP
jgi:hypothetical protein